MFMFQYAAGKWYFFQAVFIVAVRVQKTISRPKGDQAMVRLKDIFLQFDFNNTSRKHRNTHPHTQPHTHTDAQTPTQHMRTDIPRHSQTHTNTHPDTHTHKYVHTHTHIASMQTRPHTHTHTHTHIASIRTRAHRATTHIPGIHLPVILVRKNDRKM